jgi:hypothetical protein
MTDHASKRTIAALEKMMQEMQFLVDNPRMQQKRWVAMGRTWLPILNDAKEDLLRLGQSDAAPSAEVQASPAAPAGEESILIKISQGSGETYLNLKLDEIAEVSVAHHSEPGQKIQSDATNSFRLRNGTAYLTTVHETKRLVEALASRNKL